MFLDIAFSISLLPNVTNLKEIEDVSKFDLRPFSSVGGLSVCFWIQPSPTDSEERSEMISSVFESKHLSLSITNEGFLITTSEKTMKINLYFPINQRTHVCFTAKRYFNIYVNGLRYWTSKLRLSPFSNSTFKSVLHLMGYLDMSRGNKVPHLRGSISEFYLLGKELKLNDIRSFFPTCTGYGGEDKDILITWIGLMQFAEDHSLPLQKVHY